ncbi:hypothetical protein CSUB01_05963 [Colletotrichum sublineola]|uniref:C2H2-type domain-containing protein n=1 Tax=Colletotrichum sublineola TaxID=1173701 RepID=A0A066X4V5_COLSU|nr:hypothetical protein CSUB01_05963 [Colletotrichum sublineola]
MGLPAPSAWAASHNDTTMGNSSLSPYDWRVTMSAPTNGAIMAPQYMATSQYIMTPMQAIGQYPTQNNFAHTQHDSPPANTNMPFRHPAQQAQPVMPVAPSEHDVSRASSYTQESPSAPDDQHHSPSSRSGTKMRNPETPHPLNTKEIKFNKPTSADLVNFTTAIDTLMKAVQKRPDSEGIIQRVSGIEEVIEPEHALSPKPEAGPTSTASPARTYPPRPKRYICDVDGCGKSFYQSAHLDTHRRAHTGEKPYQCNWPRCGRTFSQPGNLKTHMRRHTGEKPFRCEQCSKVFAQRGNLQTHMTTHTNAKPFLCKLDDCNKTFTQRGNLKNHQNKYHEKALMEITDWIVSISDIDALSDDQREMYGYFANLYKNSNKGIKGRGKDRRVSNRGAKSKTAPSSYPIKRVPGPASLAAYSSKRLPPPEQYISSPRYDGLTDIYCGRGYDGRLRSVEMFLQFRDLVMGDSKRADHIPESK